MRKSWIREVRSDFEWVVQLSGLEFPVELMSLRSIAAADKVRRAAVRRHVVAICQSATANSSHAWASLRGHRNMAEAWICSDCGAQYFSKQALAVHQFNKHGRRRLSRLFVESAHCPACLMWFHDRERLIVHLEEKAPLCKLAVATWCTELSVERLSELDADTRQRSRLLRAEGRGASFALKPAFRLPGPRLAPFC